MNTSLDSLVQPDRVHRRVYTDAAIFGEEMRRIFRRTWIYVGHETEIPKAGDFKTVSLGRQPIILSRDESGAIHALYNRCRHRGATVCQEKRGNSRFFQCAYHGWTYGMDGQLAVVTWPEGYGADFDARQYGLAHVARTATYRGFIFVSASPDGPGLDEHLGNARPWIDAFVDSSPRGSITVANGAHTVTYKGNWKLQTDNGVDGYHASFLHRSYFKIRKRRGQGGVTSGDREGAGSRIRTLDNGHAVLDRRESAGDAGYRQLKETSAGAKYLAELQGRVGPDRARQMLNGILDCGFNLMVYPNLHLVGVAGNHIRNIVPVAVDETVLTFQPVTLDGVPDELYQTAHRMYVEFFGPAGFGQSDDSEIFARVQEGLQVEDVDWVLLSRGLEREKADGAGVSSYSSDETAMRAQYARWKRYMTA
jgi:phenylpropionate dioxygenase-like ring-hydroxylating dioxygenase large terminal subunit